MNSVSMFREKNQKIKSKCMFVHLNGKGERENFLVVTSCRPQRGHSEREREIPTVVRYDGGPAGVNSRGIHHNCLNSLILFADCHKVNHLARCERDEAGWNKCGG